LPDKNDAGFSQWRLLTAAFGTSRLKEDVRFHGESWRVSGPSFNVDSLRPIRGLKKDEPALVSAVGGAGSAMLFSVAAAI
jgi:hypothetical protein